MKKPWNEHSSKWEVPWDERPEQQDFDVNPGGLLTTIISLVFYGGIVLCIMHLLDTMRA